MQDQAKSVADASLSKYKKVCFYNQHLRPSLFSSASLFWLDYGNSVSINAL